jgi:hypothetical protein
MSSVADRFASGGGDSLDESTAKAFDRLSTADKIKLMSVLRSLADVPRYNLMFNVGDPVVGLDYDFLVKYAVDGLCLNVSHKGRGRSDIVQGIVANVQKARGVLGGAVDFIRGK